MAKQHVIRVEEVLNGFYKIADARQWHSKHSARNLASAICVEAAELLQEFQWLDCEQQSGDAVDTSRVGAELADILMYVLVLCDKLDLEPASVLEKKMRANLARFASEPGS